jgi:hypothetical protein
MAIGRVDAGVVEQLDAAAAGGRQHGAPGFTYRSSCAYPPR